MDPGDELRYLTAECDVINNKLKINRCHDVMYVLYLPFCRTFLTPISRCQQCTTMTFPIGKCLNISGENYVYQCTPGSSKVPIPAGTFPFSPDKYFEMMQFHGRSKNKGRRRKGERDGKKEKEGEGRPEQKRIERRTRQKNGWVMNLFNYRFGFTRVGHCVNEHCSSFLKRKSLAPKH